MLMKEPIPLERLFVCPKCKAPLRKLEQAYECQTCHSQYPTVQGVPVFITGQVASDKMNEFWDKGWQNRVEAGDHQFLKEDSQLLRAKLLENVQILKAENHPIIETDLTDGKIILNIGCGTGEAPLFIVQGAINYIGLDYSFNAAKYSYDAIKKLGGTGITAQANAEALPIEDNSIDLVYSNGVLHHTPETINALDEVYRVLKPGGKAIIGLYNTYSPLFLWERFKGTITRYKYKNWYERSERAWQTGQLTNPWTKTYSKRELKSIFSKYQTSELNFRKNGFLWANTIPRLGRLLDDTGFGQCWARYFAPKFGSMWVITFTANKFP